MTITFVFTVDIDNDGLSTSNERNTLVWDSVDQVPPIADVFARRGVTATWFVRADNQLGDVYGDEAWLLYEREPLWSALRRDGHSVGWHPHVVRRETDGWFVPETDDERCADSLRAIHAALAATGFAFSAARIGEAFHGNQSMRALDELGIAVDSTGLPGRRRHDEARCFDWSCTPNHPYRPSAADYRVPGETEGHIVEVPMTVVPVQAPYDPCPLPRYLNLAYREDVLRQAFESHLASLGEGDHVVVTILHPDEACGPAAHPLYAHNLDTVARNLDHLLAAAGDYGDIEVATLEQVAQRVAEGPH